MKKAILIFSIFSICLNMYSQDWSWSIKATGDDQRYMAADMAVDTEGNMVVAGYFQENLTLGNFSIFTPDDYFADLYLTKINSNKEVVWMKTFETDWCYGDNVTVVVDDEENIYMTGNFDERIYVTKFDPDGNQIWHNNFSEEHYGYGLSIALDQFDNVYVAGGYGNNFFMSKLNYDGEVVWLKDIYFNYSDAVHITDINVDRLGNIYFVGVFGIETLVLDNFVLEHNGSWGQDALWGKMDTDGNFIWINSSDGRTNADPQIALTSDGYLYLSGSFYGDITFDGILIPGICCQNPKPYMAKYDVEGNVIWAKGAFTTGGERGTTIDMKVNYAGNLYLTGAYSYYSTNAIYLEEYEPNGDHLWRKEFSMTSGTQFTNAIDLDNQGFAYYVGYNNSETFINENLLSPTSTIGVAQLNTFSSTYKKTPRPQIERMHTVCELGVNVTLNAIGSNIKWYSDPNLDNLVFQGNSYTFQTNESLKLYVTQTVNNITSWPKEVIVSISELDTAELTFDDPILTATYNPLFIYKWFYLDEPIANATDNFIEITSGTDYTDYGVLINQQNCQIALGRAVLSTGSFEKIPEFSLYPNPTSGIFKISSNSPIDYVEVFTNLGQLVLSNKISSELDISTFKTGLYFVKVVDVKGNVGVKKLIME
jgi:hypothetical protein